ncbi:acyltransferase [Galactobacter sp.]|uniref:acyltransferase family protein n=1 Tax=Galactobacter sp. TaxID=2676125 RepID=UPI0025BC4F9E|nr:acyltransferase [Galactobacter sp.]
MSDPDRPRPNADRDLSIDLVRVGCVLLVVFVHLVLVGVGRNPDGSLLITSGVENARWATPASWAAEIMPLFFVIGGFTARIGYRSSQARGETSSGFIRKRLDRLARPALPLYLFLSVGLLTATALGVPPKLLDAVATPVGSVLWFLGAYMTVQALAPIMIRWHERSPYGSAATLIVAALAVDIIRLVVGIRWLDLPRIDKSGYGFGEQFFGLPNMVLVWLFCQQIGFLLHDGAFERLSRLRQVGVAIGGVAALLALTYFGSYSWFMLTNQWPPTTPLAILAVIQAAAYTLLRPTLQAVMRTRPAQGMVMFFGPRLMTIYLWHVSAICALTALIVFGPWGAPTPGGAIWWWTRPLMLVGVLGIVWAISLGASRLELPRPARTHPAGPVRVSTAVVLFVLPSVAISLYGLDLWLACFAVAATWLALVISRGRGPVSTAL